VYIFNVSRLTKNGSENRKKNIYLNLIYFFSRKVWEYFLETCNEQKSFFGLKFSVLKAQLNSAELRKTYVLNPLAPEFVPNRLYHVTSQQNMGSGGVGAHGPANPGYFVGQRMMYPGAPYPQQVILVFSNCILLNLCSLNTCKFYNATFVESV
jgi:hypothetical protein